MNDKKKLRKKASQTNATDWEYTAERKKAELCNTTVIAQTKHAEKQTKSLPALLYDLHSWQMQQSGVTSFIHLEPTVYKKAAAATGKLQLNYSELYILLWRISGSPLRLL